MWKVILIALPLLLTACDLGSGHYPDYVATADTSGSQ